MLMTSHLLIRLPHMHTGYPIIICYQEDIEKTEIFIINEKTKREYDFRSLERDFERMKEEIEQLDLQKQALARENRRLQDDLAAATKDCLTARRELDMDKQDVENLKKQLQQYVTEVKKAEELLTKKESERNQMLEHFRSLSIEATTLETNNHTLESTVENTKTQLLSANNRIMDLEHEIASKDSLLYNYEKQIAELSGQVAELEMKLKQETDMRMGAEEDLAALRDLCSTLDIQKEALKRQASNIDAEKVHLINEVRRLSEEYEGLNEKLTHEKSLSQTLEKSLSNSRQETLEHKITNKDLQMHVQNLRQKVDELTQKLETESHDVRRYQSQCAELSQQVSELRREVTNARFEHAKSKEDSTKRCTCLSKSQSDEEFPCSVASSFRSLPTSSRTYTRAPESVAQCTVEEPDIPIGMRFVLSRNITNENRQSFSDSLHQRNDFNQNYRSNGSNFSRGTKHRPETKIGDYYLNS
ncbi:hypothetical protein RUM44_007892 [Polyplax serrata]|uniref:Uncharacterized protein n=1 Tax=Polyplax serrata TaxID=468196 RepID=A0ABR1B7E0_POLSC